MEPSENSRGVHLQISYTLRRTSTAVDVKGGCYKKIPWRVAEAEDPEQAGICADQLKNGDRSTYGPLEICYLETLVPALEEPSPALKPGASAVGHINLMHALRSDASDG